MGQDTLGFNIFLAEPVNDDRIRTSLEKWFPEVKCASLEQVVGIDAKNIYLHVEEWPPFDDWPPIVFDTDAIDAPDFPWKIDFQKFPGNDGDAIPAGIVLARRMSIEFDCRTLCEGTGYGDNGSPYWSIMCEKGIPHLANDAHSAIYENDSSGRVEIIREIEIPDLDLDELGHLRK